MGVTGDHDLGTSQSPRFARLRRLATAQPALAAYVAATTDGLSPEAQEGAWRGLELIDRALDARGADRVALPRILALAAANDDFMLKLTMAHPQLAARWLRHGVELHQATLLESVADEMLGQVPPGERGAVFLALKTVIDALEEGRPAT